MSKNSCKNKSTRKSIGGNRNERRNNTKDRFRNEKDSNHLTDSGGLSKFDRATENDWRWYVTDEQLLKDTSSLAYGYPLGSRLNLGAYGDEFNQSSVSGIMSIHIAPTFGQVNSPTDPLNVAAYNIYSFVRHANSGHSNYEAADLMIYLMAMDSIYSFMAFLRRVYGVASLSSAYDRYYPRAVLNAMEVDYDDVVNNLANFRARINAAAVKVGSLCVPATMSIFARHEWLYSYLWKDKDAPKSQTYLFNPYGFYRFIIQRGVGALGFKKYVGGQDHYYKVSELFAFLDDMLDRVLNEEDFAIMSGDILKAYTPNNLYKIGMIPEDYTVIPMYSEEVLDQIQNATLLGDPNESTFSLLQTIKDTGDNTTGYLESHPQIQYSTSIYDVSNGEPGSPTSPKGVIGRNVLLMDRLINFDRNDVTPADTMVASRLVSFASPEYEGLSTNAFITTCGTEIATFARIYTYGVASDGSWYPLTHYRLHTNFSHILAGMNNLNSTQLKRVSTYISNVEAEMSKLSQFHRHPFLFLSYGFIPNTYQQAFDSNWANITVTTDKVRNYNGDLNNYGYLNEAVLQQMNQTALLNEFSVTQYGKGSTL